MIDIATVKIAGGMDLTNEEAYAAIDEIMSGNVDNMATASFLTALQVKGATPGEVTASARAMRDHAEHFDQDGEYLEIVGTGGDKSGSFNISTTSAFVCAAGGVKVAKHGNRAATSKSGAADVLEALGACITLSPESSRRLLEETGFCFLFAARYHKAMKYVAPVRKALPIPTVFNLLGPMTNPAAPKYQLLGVYSEKLVVPMAHVLHGMGVKHGLSIFGTDGLDEISASAETKVCEFIDDEYNEYVIKPEDFGLVRGKKEDIIGGTPEENAEITRSVLNGAKGTQRNAVLMNAGAAFYVTGNVPDIRSGVEMAAELIDSGSASKTMNRYIEMSQKLSESEQPAA